MNKIKGMVVFIDTDFNLKLKEYMLNLEKKGIHKTRADLVIELARIGFLQKSEIQTDGRRNDIE
jgi:hypothetical protein